MRIKYDQRTKHYVAWRTAEGKSKRDIIRCLKRYVAREIYRVLVSGTLLTAIHTSTDQVAAENCDVDLTGVT